MPELEENQLVYRKMITKVFNSYLNGKLDETNTFFRTFILNGLTAFIFNLVYVVALKRFREMRLRFVITIASISFCLVTSLNNETVCAINPILCFPMTFGSFYFTWEILFFTIVVPVLFGFLGVFTALKGYKDILIAEKETSYIADNLQLMKPKKLIFEL